MIFVCPSVHTQRIMASEEFEGLSVEGLELCRPEVARLMK